MKIKFKSACDGFVVGQIADLPLGTADAYCRYRKAAEEVKDEPSPESSNVQAMKSRTFNGPPSSKAVRREDAVKKTADATV